MATIEETTPPARADDETDSNQERNGQPESEGTRSADEVPDVQLMLAAVVRRLIGNRGSFAEDAPHLTVLLPTKNEENGILPTLGRIPADTLREMGYRLEVLVVDGHSTDHTRTIAEAAGARVVLQEGKGKGWGVRSALAHVEGDFVVMLDSDGSYPPEMIPEFLEHLEDGIDVVMGSRLDGEMRDGAMSKFNHLGNRFLTWLARALYRHPVTDLCTGMWGFRREALDALPLNSHHFEIEAELFSQSVKAGLEIHEIPIPYTERMGEEKLSSVRDGVRIASKLVRKRFVH